MPCESLFGLSFLSEVKRCLLDGETGWWRNDVSCRSPDWVCAWVEAHRVRCYLGLLSSFPWCVRWGFSATMICAPVTNVVYAFDLFFLACLLSVKDHGPGSLRSFGSSQLHFLRIIRCLSLGRTGP